MKPSAVTTGPLKAGDRILDKYEVRGLLGKGGHAFVYDCFNAFLAEEVAIKVIPNPGQRGGRPFKRARGEAQVLYRLNHPNVVRVMDGGELNGMAYIVMEKLDGVSLRQHLRSMGALTVVEALLIALQVAEALEAAHGMNVIHRDLKPDNIFLLPENHVKVLDFGIAKFLEGGDHTTEKDLIQGTAPYMSPEQAQGLGITFASDIFQLGTIIYEMIAGICPCMIGVEEPTLQLLVSFQIAKLPPRLKSRVRGVPDYVDRLVWRAIAKQAQQRFATMREVTEAIRSALERLQVELPPEALAVRSVPTPRKSSRPPEHGPGPDPGVVQRGDTEQIPPEPLPDAPLQSLQAIALDAARASSLPAPNVRRTPSGRAMTAAMVGRPKPSPVSDETPQRVASVRIEPIDARTMLLRAVTLGAIVALPVGLVLGLSRRQHTARIGAVVHSAPASIATISPDPVAAPSANERLAIAPADSSARLPPTGVTATGTPRPQTVPQTAAASPRQPAAASLIVHAASGLDEITQPRRTALPTASPATPSSPPARPKSIF